jgi:hypothetical protein
MNNPTPDPVSTMNARQSAFYTTHDRTTPATDNTDTTALAEGATTPLDLIAEAAKEIRKRATWPSLHWPNVDALQHQDVAEACARAAFGVFAAAQAVQTLDRDVVVKAINDVFLGQSRVKVKRAADAVLAALAVPATGEVETVEKLKVAATLPHPGGTSSAEFMRGAARNLEQGYEVGGSGVTAAVVRVLRVVADAVGVTP